MINKMFKILLTLVVLGFCLEGVTAQYDFIVVGSGPGGAPLAARLAERRFKVLVLEAGSDYYDPTIQCPLTFTAAALNTAVSWDFWVKHYTNTTQAVRDSKYYADPDKQGVLYPRASGIGGCGLHHVLNLVYPANSDFQTIADLVDDSTWSPDAMRTIWERIELNRIASPPTTDADYQATRRGFTGYIPHEHADMLNIGQELGTNIFSILQNTPGAAGYPKLKDGDYNRWDNNGNAGWGYPPMETLRGQRYGIVQMLKKAVRENPEYLTIQTDSLVSRILFDGDRAVGVEYLKGPHLYAAHTDYNAADSHQMERVYASKEVIVSGGTFNSPQILKLSGIGPKEELEALGVPVKMDLPGVGSNMQDRIEVGLNFQLKSPNPAYSSCPFTLDANDPCYQRLITTGDNFYGTNSLVYYSNKKSSNSNAADLVLFSGFGYFLGYSPRMGDEGNTYGPQSIASFVLKAFTKNNAGTVKLLSTDPRERPLIEFHYFSEGTDTTESDLDAVVEAVKESRRVFSQPSIKSIIDQEIGTFADATTDAQIRQKILDEAWGHHACCTNKIGAKSDPMAVVDGDFRVYGVSGLRVVDMSVFPKIPGYFPLGAIYMISEKAADVISAQYSISSASLLSLGFAPLFLLFIQNFL